MGEIGTQAHLAMTMLGYDSDLAEVMNFRARIISLYRFGDNILCPGYTDFVP